MKISKLFIPVLFLSLLGGCKKSFEEINTDRNNPTEVPPELLLSGIIKNMMDRQVNEAWGIGNIVVQHHAKIQFVNEDRYLWGERNDIWNTVYDNNRNLQNIFAMVDGDEKNPFFGVSLVLKSWMFSLVTDAYGDVPYSQAGMAKTEGIYNPVYDTQEEIYNGILSDLKKANEVLATAGPELKGDVLFGGGASGIVKWRKLANSLRIRAMMRISAKKNVNAELQEIIANPAANPIFESNADNAELKYFAAAPNQWPLYGNRVGSFDEFRVSKTLTDRLTALNDPRLKVFGRPTQTSVATGTPVIAGVPNGLSDVDALAYNGGVQGVSRVGYTFACLVCNDINQTAPDPAAARALLMTYAELQFLLAEARQKGMISTGDAKEYYEKGITANFNYWQSIVPVAYNLDITMPANYLTQASVAFAGTDGEKLARIAMQKWIALYFNGLEAWFDWRRTNMPAIVPGPSNLNGNMVPVRFIYPLSAQSLNGENRVKAVERQGGTDDINTKMWLLKP
ncbi:MAG: SusD/RagB family nutrient-binding outer membrane lipoprotein [Chitinophagaceae bacterium]